MRVCDSDFDSPFSCVYQYKSDAFCLAQSAGDEHQSGEEEEQKKTANCQLQSKSECWSLIFP